MTFLRAVNDICGNIVPHCNWFMSDYIQSNNLIFGNLCLKGKDTCKLIYVWAVHRA